MPSRNNGTWQRFHLKTENQCFIFFPFALGHLWLYDMQWICSVVSPAPNLNSRQTIDVSLNCTRIPQGTQGKLLH